MRALGVVTARGGSKGIPGKNLYPLLGLSLLGWTARSTRGSQRLQRVILSTEDDAIAAEGERLGLEVPFRRPTALAQDDTPTLPVLIHALDTLAASGERYDAVFILQPTNPLRLVSDIDGALELLERTGADSVIGFTPVGDRHPARMKRVDDDGRVSDPPFAEAFAGQRRQELPPYWLREGSVYAVRTATLRAGTTQGQDCRAWRIPTDRACNIDEPFDLWLAEHLLRRQHGPGPHA